MEECSTEYDEEESDRQNLLLGCQRKRPSERMRRGSRTKDNPMIVLMPAMAEFLVL